MSLVDQFKALVQGRFAKTVATDNDNSEAASRDDATTVAMDPDSELRDFSESRMAARAAEPAAAVTLGLPLLGQRSAAQHQRILAVLLALALLVLSLLALLALRQAERVTQQLAANGRALMQSQRLAKAVSPALVGIDAAFAEVKDSSAVLTSTLNGLKNGDSSMGLSAVDDDQAAELESAQPLIERTEASAKTLLEQQKLLVQVGAAMRQINTLAGKLLERAEAVEVLKQQQAAPTAEILATDQLVMLTQRIARAASQFLTLESVGQDTVAQIAKDLSRFREVATGLRDGSAELKLSAAKDAALREHLDALLKVFEQVRSQAAPALANSKGLLAARAAHGQVLADSEPLRQRLEQLQVRLTSESGLSVPRLMTLTLAGLLALLAGSGLAYVQLQDIRQRQSQAEQLRLEAVRQEQSAKRVNDATQAAILRLMNELQSVSEGDLTQEATVTEDITGAIADSINYTVEELRLLVGNVQNTATRVAQTTAQVDSTSTELLAASGEQLREIRETGRSVLDMAARINQVSQQAQDSTAVAHQSMQAAGSGLQAVQNAIGGMNIIRDQIQDTSKRIKRLGESSQEIGEITELISDITEQTNVLALNAAIQAASAGEAGRGFSVVAEEVQRLAERSADATRQISTLVRAIQADTQDAIAAMERSTRGVVEGTRLSDTAGAELAEIDAVSRQLATLIEQISQTTSREAELANIVADNIQHIFAVTEQTSEGTRSTAQQVRDLSRMAEELRQSVARFKIA